MRSQGASFLSYSAATVRALPSPGRDADLARSALSATAAWTRDDLGLELRAALVPVSDVRQHGLDVRVARFGPSGNVSFAMFSGGGLAWAEAAMKEGRFAVAPASPGTRPDLSGLSCRWDDIPAMHGLILSLVVAPVSHGDPAFRVLVQDLFADLEASPEVARPVPDQAPGVSWPPPGVDLEAHASRRAGESFFVRRLKVLLGTLLAYGVMKFGIRLGNFDPARYRREVVENSDFRKFDDNLRMTLDCTPAVADRIEKRLGAARASNIARFGLHRQPAAIMTCIVPSIFESNHVHFVDGAAGGYALAANSSSWGHRPLRTTGRRRPLRAPLGPRRAPTIAGLLSSRVFRDRIEAAPYAACACTHLPLREHCRQRLCDQ